MPSSDAARAAATMAAAAAIAWQPCAAGPGRCRQAKAAKAAAPRHMGEGEGRRGYRTRPHLCCTRLHVAVALACRLGTLDATRLGTPCA